MKTGPNSQTMFGALYVPGKMRPFRWACRTGIFVSLIFSVLSACSPQAADEYRPRESETPQNRDAPTAPIISPDTGAALWTVSSENNGLLYGIPGARPMLVLACKQDGAVPLIRIVRRAPTDAGAKAIMAAIGNGQIQRLKMDASWTGRDWVWEGSFAAYDPRLAVFKGNRDAEVTIPGGGTLVVKPSPLPASLIDNCAAAAMPTEPDAAPGIAAPSSAQRKSVQPQSAQPESAQAQSSQLQ